MENNCKYEIEERCRKKRLGFHVVRHNDLRLYDKTLIGYISILLNVL